MTGTEVHERSVRALTSLRVLVAPLLIVHGVARTVPGIVDDFGGFLTSVGFPLGTPLAWSITGVEIVVGAGRNGVEYSVLLIAVLLSVAYGTPRRERVVVDRG